ncbi:MAG: Lipid II flippase FtsW [Candidatus Hinthialibacteria bacterium OLB16]|nr:MAG: Lipid II flippase FtsW [Candidatus Hinthialibacteria bacterium OLB16]
MKRWIDRMAPHMIFCFTTLLVLFGLIMVYSSSAFSDYRKESRPAWEKAVESAILQAETKSANAQELDPNQLLESLRQKDSLRRASMLNTFVKQICWVLIGFMAMGAAVLVDYPLWGKKIGWLLLVTFCLQAALFLIPANNNLPVQARIINGSRSWLQVFGFRLQPSELVKLTLVIFCAWYLSRKASRGTTNFFAMLPSLPIFCLSIGLILCESDKGVAVHLCLSLLLLWMIAVGRFSQVLILGAIASVALGVVISTSPEALGRIESFLGTDSFQLQQAKDAFSRGGWLGRGLGNSDAALSAYLYGAHTDFIMAVVGEELGFACTSILVTGYFLLCLVGLKVAAACTDPFGSLLALGITLLIGTQAFLNMAIVTGLAPTTGFTLPLLSYGGSSLTWTMIGIGILLNVSLSTHNHLLRGHNRVKPNPFGTGRAMA